MVGRAGVGGRSLKNCERSVRVCDIFFVSVGNAARRAAESDVWAGRTWPCSSNGLSLTMLCAMLSDELIGENNSVACRFARMSGNEGMLNRLVAPMALVEPLVSSSAV